MKIYKYIKLGLFIILGILVLVFNKAIMQKDGEYINILVGSIMLLYGLDAIILILITKEYKKEQIKFLNGFINILLAVIMIFFLENKPYEFVTGCVIWSLWSIMREGEEIFEKVVEEFKKTPVTSFINFAESVVVIVFSVGLILNPGEHHAHLHVILLGIELILEVVWVYIAKLESLFHKKNKS